MDLCTLRSTPDRAVVSLALRKNHIRWGWGPLKGAVKGSKTETRELLGGTEMCFPNKWSQSCPLVKSIFFTYNILDRPNILLLPTSLPKLHLAPAIKYLRHEEWCEGDIDYDPLVDGFPDHFSHKLEKWEVVVCHVGERGRVEPLVRGGTEKI